MLAPLACWMPDEDAAGSGECLVGCEETDADSDSDADADADPPEGFAVAGGGRHADTTYGIGPGLTVSIADPTDAMRGEGGFEILGTGETDADSDWRVEGVVTDSSIGLFIVVSGSDVLASATGVGPASYASLGDGDTLDGQTAQVVTTAFASAIDVSAAVLGYEGSVKEDGVLLLAVVDEHREPVREATVSCGDCDTPIYYFDRDESDGLFTHAGTVNAMTGVDGLVAVPGGAIGNYEAEAGEWSGSQLAGTLPGLSAFIFIAVD